MQKIEEVVIKKDRRLVSTECDLCDNVTEDDYRQVPLWPLGKTTVITTVAMEEVNEGKLKFNDIESLDVCPRCFKEKILPLKKAKEQQQCQESAKKSESR